MDKQLLQALNNLSTALEEIAFALQDNQEAKSATANAIKGGDFGKQLETINNSIKSIKVDTQEILKNQKTIIALSKEKQGSKMEVFESDAKKESAIKQGVGTILLIAGAVLAIGLAFKIVGGIDFLSVVALSIAIVLIAVAFERVARLKLTLKEALITSATMVLMSIALAVSSWALGMIKPITLAQAVTGILIGGIFSVVAFGLKNVFNAFAQIGITTITKSSIFLPLVLPAIALGIALSSWALSTMTPISLAQALSAVLISIVFSVISVGLGNILGAFKGLSMGDITKASLMMPVLFTAFAFSIMISSYFLSQVSMISLGQFLVSLGITILFTILSFGMVEITKAISKMKWEDVVKVPTFFTLLSLAIMISSHILANTADIKWELMLKIAALGVILGIIVAVLSVPLRVLGKMPIKDIALGSLGIVLIATAIMLSSWILSIGNYQNSPSPKWTLGVALSLLAFIPAVVVLGLIAMTGIGAVAIAAGAGMVLLVAGTIVATSYILALGKYDKFPSVAWSTSVAISMAAFATGMVLLGGIIVGTFGLGGIALAAGSAAVLSVAETIVRASFILSKGKYTGGPTKDWAEGISLALGAFAPIYNMLMLNGIMKIFGGGGIGPKEFSQAIKTISLGIVDSATFFSNAKVAFKNPPPVEWARGVGLAIGAFAPVYKVLAESDGWIKDGPSVEDMKNAILTISDGIITAADKFAQNSAVFDITKVPSAKWGKGVGAAIGAFAPVFKALSEDTGWFTSGDEVITGMKKGIIAITNAIISSGRIFSKADVKWTSYPSRAWAGGVSSALKAFSPIFKSLSEDTGWFTSGDDVIYNMTKGIKAITNSIVYSAKKISSVGTWNEINPNFMKSLSKNIKDYSKLANYLINSENDGVIDATKSGGTMNRIVDNMIKLSNGYDILSKSLSKFSSIVNGIDADKMKMLKDVNGVITKEIRTIRTEGGGPKAVTKQYSSIQSSFGGVKDTNTIKTQQNQASRKKVEKKLDEIIKVLKRIDTSAQSLDEALNGMSSANMTGPSNLG